ncbi:mucin-5AC-like [Neolamprologus brichardi]|uniref:mucin-5AC-like n=1 Tax=Neolamprologus brichardi TaxID=32507 RepID=UPI001643885C|nr:mucin-5AC-like [Neolamprologus brichardi]
MKMRNLLLGLLLGLLAAVHSTPVNTVTQNPANPDAGFLEDAMTEGFIVGPSPTLTTETPKISATVQASQTPVYNSEDMTEGSAAGKISDILTTSISPHETTTLSISNAQTSGFIESAVNDGSGLGETSDESPIAFTLDTTTTNATNAPTSNSTESYMFEGSAVESTIPIAFDTTTATHAPTSDFTEHYMLKGRGSGYTSPSLFSHTTTTSVTSEDQSSNTSNNNVLSQTTDPAVSTSDVTTNVDSGSGSELVSKSTTMTSGSSVETSTVSSELSKQNRNFLHRENNQYNIKAPQTQTQMTNTEPTHKGHVTPDWIIILGFIVGVAALVILCVAIATRHKWNGPNQANLTVASNNLSNQKREREMETFLPNEKPKENGHSGEYTVIPLEDVPEYGPTY